MKFLRTLTFAAVLFAAANSAHAATVYTTIIQDSTNLNSVLATIDPLTGVITQIGATGVNIQSMAYDSTNDVLYAAGVDPSDVTANFQLYTIDRNSGALSLVGDLGWQFATAMTYDSDSDTLFAQVGFVFDYLTTIDRQSGAATQVDPNTLGIGAVSMEYLPTTQELVFLNNSGQYGAFDPTDGSATVFGAGGLSGISALGFDGTTDQLLGLSNSGLYSVDFINGSTTLLTNIEFGFYGSMAVVPVPLPAAFWLLLCPLLGWLTGSAARRRSR